MPRRRRPEFAEEFESEVFDPRVGPMHFRRMRPEPPPAPERRFEPGGPLPADGTRPSNNGLDLGTALGAMLGGEGFLKHLEAQGSREVRGRNVLPTNGTSAPDVQKIWLALGFELGEPFADDKLFRPARFPPGWRIDYSRADANDPRHLCLYDEKDRVRGYMFYSSVFYDRDANIYFKRRYRVDYLSVHDPEVRAMEDRVGENPLRDAKCIFDTLLEQIVERVVVERQEGEKLYEYSDRVQKVAGERLLALFPNANDPLAYWD